jgi:N-acetylneuraminate lyase
MTLRLTGLIAAAYTPMNAEGALNLAAIERLCEHFITSKVSGAFVCGTTGECHSLSTAERKQIAEEWTNAAAGRMPVVIHVGHNSLPDALELAAHAQAVGADAIACMAPFFFKPETLDDLVDYCAVVAAAAADLPFYYYDIPSMTGVSFPMAEFLDTAATCIPNLAGLKYSNVDLVGLQECLALDGGRYNVLFGCDEIMLAGMTLGAHGGIGSTYNYAASIYHRLFAAMQANDHVAARQHQLQSVALVRAMQDFGVLRAGKSIVAMLGVDCGPVRAPLRPLSEAEERMLYAAIRELDVFSGELKPPMGTGGV